MKIGKLSLTIVLGIFIFLSCSEEEDDLISQNCEENCTEIVGKIMTDDGSTPISNLKISLVWNHDPNSGPDIIRTKASTRTDNEGNYSLKFYLRDDELDNGFHRLYHDQIENNEFLGSDLNGINSFFELNRDTLLIQNHNIPKKAYLNLSFLNLDQVQQGNSLITEFSYPRPLGFSQSIDGQVRGWNSESEQNHLIEIVGNQTIELKIYRTINGVSTTEIETLFFDAGTTSDYIIDFND